MLSLLEQLGEALAGALGKPRAATVPAPDQISHAFGRPGGGVSPAVRDQRFKRVTHHLGLSAPGLTRDSLKEGRHFRVDPDVKFSHTFFVTQPVIQSYQYQLCLNEAALRSLQEAPSHRKGGDFER
jgi:hypothetical protein